MTYVTVQQLVDGADALKEVSELYAVSDAILSVVIAGGDTSGWPVDEVEAAGAAVASVRRFITQADGEVDARLVMRGYSLPLSADDFPVLSVWSRAIARYHLHRQRDRTSEETGRIERDYREALRALDMVAAGKLGIGKDDPLAPPPVDPSDPQTGSVRIVSGARIFSRDTLGGL